jgi:SAM-dependent methyltransferase
MIFSEKLQIGWDGKSIKAPNRSGIYWDIFSKWWNIFHLHGDILLVGDEYPHMNDLRPWFMSRHPMINNVFSTSLENSDINWDITTPFEKNTKFDFVICQAVLEHVKDPVSATKNLANVIYDDGFVFLHSHGPKFKEHRYPIDCYRFMRDGVIALIELAGLDLVDILYTDSHWFTLSIKAGK